MSPIRAAQTLALSAALLLPTLAAPAQADDRLRGLLPAVKAAEVAAPALEGKIWPGFKFREAPIVLFDASSRRALLVHFSVLPEGFVPADPAQPGTAFGALPDGLTLFSGAAQPFAGRLAGFVDASELDGATEAVARHILFRGAFQVYGQYAGVPAPPGLPSGGYPTADSENSGLLRAEARLCVQLAHASAAEAPALASALLSMRARRQGRLTPEVAAFERGRENADGLAEYAGLSSVERAAALPMLDALLDAAAAVGKAAIPRRFAATGAAQALAFDAALPGWKGTFQKGTRDSLEPLLRTLAGSAAPADMASLGVEALIAEESQVEKEREARQALLLATVEKAKGLVLVLKLASALDLPGVKWSSRYDPKGKVTLDETRVLHSNFKLTGTGLLDYTASRPSLYVVRSSVTAGFNPEEVPFILVDGSPATFTKESASLIGRVEVRGAQFQLTVERALAEWDASSRRLTVTPMAPPEPGG